MHKEKPKIHESTITIAYSPIAIAHDYKRLLINSGVSRKISTSKIVIKIFTKVMGEVTLLKNCTYRIHTYVPVHKYAVFLHGCINIIKYSAHLGFSYKWLQHAFCKKTIFSDPEYFRAGFSYRKQ